MNPYSQLFEVANLIFISYEGAEIKTDDSLEIQSRFQEILNSFTSYETIYNTNYIRKGKSSLPYNSGILVGEVKDNLILHFTDSYNEPLMIIINKKEGYIRNFINIEDVRYILNDKVFESMKEDLHYPVNLNERFPIIHDINKFIGLYKRILERHSDENGITSHECFEIKF